MNIIETITAVFATIACIFSLIPNALGIYKDTYQAENPDEVLMNAVLIADIHADGDPVRDRNDNLRRLLADINASEEKLDAIAVAGDITNCGNIKEYINLAGMLFAYNKAENFIPSMGNHDSRATCVEEPYFDEGSSLFQNFLRLQGIKTETNYYYKVVNGCYFIALGTESMPDPYISDTQIAWVDSLLAEAAKTGMPCFIISHELLMGTHDDANVPASRNLGEASDKLKAVVKKYADEGLTTVYVCGHLHKNFHADTLVTVSDNFYSLLLPSALYSEDDITGEDILSLGVTAEVYQDKLVIRARNFNTYEWLEDYRWELPVDIK
ncbi:MAG: metallophosphoesterase [Clostridia bacterium]|nr:metallophosphoesterase [Clostridia bacterium]MBR3954371.1 metallophosphoesterase [Clostridia bacterium]